MLSQEELNQVQAIQAGKMRPAAVVAAAKALASAKQAREAAIRSRASANAAKAAVADLKGRKAGVPWKLLKDSGDMNRIAAATEIAAADAVRAAQSAFMALTDEERASVENEVKYMTEQDSGVREIKAPAAMSGLGRLPRGLTASRTIERPITGNHLFYGRPTALTSTAAAQQRVKARAINENILRQRYNMSGWSDDRIVSPDEFD